ncbi:MAG: hypothetical protein ABR606_07090 [Vicinamibacterales bacterium]
MSALCATIRNMPSATLLVALTTATLLAVEPLASTPNPRAKDGTWVTDMPGALRAETVARLNQTIGEFERASGVETALVVVQLASRT